MLREVRPDIPVLFLDTFHHFPQTLAYRDELIGEVGAQPDQPAGDGARASGCGRRRAPRRAASATRWSRSSRRSRATTRGSRRCAATSRRRAPTCRRWSRSSCRSARRSARGADRRPGPRRTCGGTPKDHDIPLLPLYDAGLHQHRLRAVHRAAVRPRQPALGPLAGPEARMRDSHPGAVVQSPVSGLRSTVQQSWHMQIVQFREH